MRPEAALVASVLPDGPPALGVLSELADVAIEDGDPGLQTVRLDW